MHYKLITDGAYSSSRNQGGLAFVFLKDDKLILEYSKSYKNCSNNQMELAAIIAGLSCVKQSIENLTIISDSMYCIGCATLNWKRKKNIKMWKLFDKEYERVSKLCSNIEFKHIKGHQKNSSEEAKWNNRCDELAVQASQNL